MTGRIPTHFPTETTALVDIVVSNAHKIILSLELSLDGLQSNSHILVIRQLFGSNSNLIVPMPFFNFGKKPPEVVGVLQRAKDTKILARKIAQFVDDSKPGPKPKWVAVIHNTQAYSMMIVDTVELAYQEAERHRWLIVETYVTRALEYAHQMSRQLSTIPIVDNTVDEELEEILRRCLDDDY